MTAAIFEALAAERGIVCGWEVGPIPKLDGHTCRCNKVAPHRLPHECDCGSWFEGCGRPGGAE